MDKLIAKIEICAQYHGLNFNKTKCVSMNFHTDGTTKYADGSEVPALEETVYLGANISKKHNIRKEVASKISQCMVILNKLNLFWSNHACSRKMKLSVLDAVIRSKLVYSLESVELTASLLSKINAFQLKGLRKILHLKTTFIDRDNSNSAVFKKANEAKNPDNKLDKDIKPFGTYIHGTQVRLLTHTVRTRLYNMQDPLLEATIATGTVFPYEYKKKKSRQA